MGDSGWNHPNKEWRETYDLARRYGWSLEARTGHTAAELKCPAGECRKIVFTSGKSTENVAKTVRNKIKSCPHRDIQVPLETAEECLSSAEKLLNGAKNLLRRSALEHQMVEALSVLEDQLAEAERLFDEAEAEYALVSSELAEAGILEDQDVGDLVQGSGPQLRQAKIQLQGLPKRDDKVLRLKSWLDRLNAEKSDLEKRVS